jgi:phenylpropionate dioxygenase-like ring-hydroxylating dioxygenase large terminal subunit
MSVTKLGEVMAPSHLGSERGLWHPVVASTQVQGGESATPQAAQLLGERLVVWRDTAGVAHVWADQCPHRGAQLSLGRVEGMRLECPYHGWQFEVGGQCVLVPAQPQWQPPASICARSFEVQERYGLVWTRLETGPSSLPEFEWEHQGDMKKVLAGPYAVDTSAPRLVENFLDMAHFGFVHEGWLGSRGTTSMTPYDVQELPERVVALDARVMQPQAYAGASAALEVSYRYEVRAPYYCLLEKNAGTGPRDAIAMFNCPVNDEQSICWFRVASTNGQISDEALIAFQDTIFAQDKPIVQSQRPKRLPIGLDASITEASGPLDRIASAYRRYLKRRDVKTGVC